MSTTSMYDRLPQGIGCAEKAEAPAEEPVVENIIVKIRLDKEEGITPASGRYSTFYNINFVHKKWLHVEGNADILSKLYPCFAVFDVNQAIWQQRSFGEAFTQWAEENAGDYYLLAPIARVSKYAYRFSGIHIPAKSTHKLDAENEKQFKLKNTELRCAGLCIFGRWSQYYTAYGVIDSRPSKSPAKRAWKAMEKAIANWLEYSIDALSICIGGNLNQGGTDNV
jgi:hypothetical protein